MQSGKNFFIANCNISILLSHIILLILVLVSVIPDSPISALFTLRSQLPITVKNISTLVNSLDISHYAKDLNMYDTEMQPETKDTLGKIEQGYVTRYDETVHKIPLKLGDLVLRGTHYSKPGLTKKLLLLFSDTLKIAETDVQI